MNILKQKQVFFNTAVARVPCQVRRLFSFGCTALTGQSVTSVRSNARLVVNNVHTAKSKAYRLLNNRRWHTVFPQLLTSVGLVNERSIVPLDFSSFGDFPVLTFALQTRHGRAIPVYFEIIPYPLNGRSQNLCIREAIERFVAAVNCRPKLVMDRGFACPFIVEYLASVGHPFIVRIQSMKKLTAAGRRLVFTAKEAPGADERVTVYRHQLRFVTSDDPGNGNEPWYLVTNDVVSVRAGVIADYYHRFEIEEFFKDAKWLQGLERLQVKTAQSLAVVLWFTILGWWFMALLERHTPVLQGRHAHDRLSFPRLVMEALQREEKRLVAAWLAAHGAGVSYAYGA